MSFDYKKFQSELFFYVEDDYREFAKRGTPTDWPFLGVRTPRQREFAKRILEMGEAEEFLRCEPESFEEVNIRGFVIAGLDYEKMLEYFDDYLLLIDNWATCDTFCSSLRKTIGKYRQEFLEEKIEKLLKSDKEFYTRVGLVLFLTVYVEFEYLFLIFEYIDSLAEREEYYVKMGMAWLLQACFVKFPEETEFYLGRTKIKKWTFNKTISKICDSRRVDRETKEKLKKQRRV